MNSSKPAACATRVIPICSIIERVRLMLRKSAYHHHAIAIGGKRSQNGGEFEVCAFTLRRPVIDALEIPGNAIGPVYKSETPWRYRRLNRRHCGHHRTEHGKPQHRARAAQERAARQTLVRNELE